MGELEIARRCSGQCIPTEDGYGSAQPQPSGGVLRMQTPWEAICVCLPESAPGSSDRAASVREAAGGRGGSEAKTRECKFRVSHRLLLGQGSQVTPRAVSRLCRKELLAWGCAPELGRGQGL